MKPRGVGRFLAGFTLVGVLALVVVTFVIEVQGVEDPSFNGLYLALLGLPWSLSLLVLPVLGSPDTAIYWAYVCLSAFALLNWWLFWGLVLGWPPLRPGYWSERRRRL